MKVNLIYEMDDDFKDYFKGVMDRLVSNITTPKIKTILVTAQPYKPYAVSFNWINPYEGIIHIDWYSVLRDGFGLFDINEIINDLNDLKIPESDRWIELYSNYIKVTKITDEVKSDFIKYEKVRIAGKYNMSYGDEAKKAMEESGLTPLRYLIILDNYRFIKPSCEDECVQLVSDYMNNL